MTVKDVYVDMQNFKLGLYALEDTTKAPFGSARIMNNISITDRGGIGPRPGTELLGSENTNGNGIRGFYNFRKSFSQNELLIKTYDDEMEIYSKNHPTAGWFKLKDGFTANKEFGFVTSLVNKANQDYAIFCNRFEDYQGWVGSVTQLSSVLVGAETEITVDSVLTDEIFESKTASASSATTLDISVASWATSQWVGDYVYITSGAQIGKIRKITANTSTKITFDTLGADPGSVTFEIRELAFPATGTLIYNGTTIAYTGVDKYNKFTVASAHAAPDNTGVAYVPTVYPANPRGNRLTNYLGRIIVGNVRSALARDTGGALQGFSSAGSYFVSKIIEPFDFGFTAIRVAGEGDIIAAPYGGGDITDVAIQEDQAYIFKKRYIESISYSQDANDLAIRDPLKAQIGSVGRVIKGSDDIYFITADNKFTSIGRVESKDITPQTENIGNSIKRLLDGYVFGQGFGKEKNDKIYIPLKESDAESNNNKLLIYNKNYKSFEGLWDLPVFGLEDFDEDLYYASSTGSNIYKMLTGHSDTDSDSSFPINAEYATHFMNLTPSKANLQALNSIYFEGYIKGNTTITFKVYSDFANDAFLEFDFSGTEEQFLDDRVLNAFLGGKPLGLAPFGSISQDVDSDGRRHFQFRVYFPFQYGNYFSIGIESSGTDYDYEVSRFGLGLKESVSTNVNKIKNI